MADPQPRFVVSFFLNCRDRVNELAEVATRVGRAKWFAGVLRTVQTNLEERPREWGDPVRDRRGMKAVEYVRVLLTDRFRIEYVVHDTEPVVFVHKLVALERNPLGEG